MLNLPALSKEHRGLRSGQFLKQLGNKSHIPILYGLKTLLAFFFPSYDSFFFEFFTLLPSPRWFFPIPPFLSFSVFFFSGQNLKQYLQIMLRYKNSFPDNILSLLYSPCPTLELSKPSGIIRKLNITSQDQKHISLHWLIRFLEKGLSTPCVSVSTCDLPFCMTVFQETSIQLMINS